MIIVNNTFIEKEKKNNDVISCSPLKRNFGTTIILFRLATESIFVDLPSIHLAIVVLLGISFKIIRWFFYFMIFFSSIDPILITNVKCEAMKQA